MSGGRADLKILQGQIKRDPEGYKEEFLLQWRHYHALLEIFRLKPSKDSAEFASLIDFLSHVTACYPEDSGSFSAELIDLLDKNQAVLDPALRRALAQALILIRNRGHLASTTLLPVCFRLFKCPDKRLRSLMYTHIVSDIQNCNKRHRDEKLNKSLQNFLYSQLQEDHEGCAKKSLAVLTELYRRNVWTDQRTVNVIASACFAKSSSILVAALKFFLGQDEKSEEGEDSDSEDDAEKEVAVSNAGNNVVKKHDIYKAYAKGVASSKKKKQAKLKRIINKAKKQVRNDIEGKSNGTFAALQLLNDPQGFAEKLFARLQANTTQKFETKLLLLGVVSRVIGTHQLQLLNFYPYIQRYLQPQQRDATKLLAIAVQACHDMVPPDAVEPLLRQLVNQFVHDKARPEVVAVGIQTVREMCVRTPLVITAELLQDLTEYKKDRDRGVRMAARSLIGLFRQLAPGMLVKKDRGKDADITRTIAMFGHSQAATRVMGVDLLAKAEQEEHDDDTDEGSGSEEESDFEDGAASDDEEGSDVKDMDEDSASASDGDGEEDAEDEEEDAEDEADVEDDEDEQENHDEEEGEEEMEEETEHVTPKKKWCLREHRARKAAARMATEEEGCEQEKEQEEQGDQAAKRRKVAESTGRPAAAAQEGSLRSLKKLAAEHQAKTTGEAQDGEEEVEPMEYGRFLTDEDFQKIKALQAEAALEDAMVKAGSKKGKQVASEQLAAIKRRMATLGETRIDPISLEGAHKRKRQAKEERLAKVYEGREDRQFGAAAARRNKKTGGLSNKQKQKKKHLPLAARLHKANKMKWKKAATGSKNFKGRKAWKK